MTKCESRTYGYPSHRCTRDAVGSLNEMNLCKQHMQIILDRTAKWEHDKVCDECVDEEFAQVLMLRRWLAAFPHFSACRKRLPRRMGRDMLTPHQKATMATIPVKIGTITFNGEQLDIYRSKYMDNDRLAIIVLSEHGEPYATVSENHTTLGLADDEFVAQTRNMTEKFTEALRRSGLFDEIGSTLFGSHSTREPIWKLRSSKKENNNEE